MDTNNPRVPPNGYKQPLSSAQWTKTTSQFRPMDTNNPTVPPNGHKQPLSSAQWTQTTPQMLDPRLGFSYRTTPVSDVESHFVLLPLHIRRHHADLLFLFKLVNGLVDCPDLLSSIDIFVIKGLRSITIFRRRLNIPPTTLTLAVCLVSCAQLGWLQLMRISFTSLYHRSEEK
ncbi:hypothetical protein J6590_069455 [Homalodisca vitripennis]|nr:hypothetical protein J6590_069455 [Homalodisca vitripennis]